MSADERAAEELERMARKLVRTKRGSRLLREQHDGHLRWWYSGTIAALDWAIEDCRRRARKLRRGGR